MFSAFFTNPIISVPLTRKKKALSLIEVMGALAVVALAVVGAIAAYNIAVNRAEGGNFAQSLSGFMTDVAQYLNVHHNESLIDEARVQALGLATGIRSKIRTNMATNMVTAMVNDAALEDLDSSLITDQVFCVDQGGTWDSAAMSCAGATPVPYPNMRRFMGLPSVRFTDTNDEDTLNEWSVMTGPNTGYDISWVIQPNTGGGTGELIALEGGGECPSHNGLGIPDTAVALEILAPNIDMCNVAAGNLSRFDFVLEAWCLDSDTTPEWRYTTNTPDQQEAALYMCLGVQR